MSLIVYQTLIGLSKESPVVLIIDDLHWMDDITFNLFELLLKKITKTECENIFLIFTSRYKENNKNKLAAVDLIKGLSKDQLLNCLEINQSF